MTDSDATAWLDATAQADLVAKGEASPEELLDAALDRAERLNPKLNAIVRPMEEEARAAIAAGLPDGPFKGVPFLLKDLGAAYAGVPFTRGSRYLRDNVAERDSTLVKRQKAAGLVTFGKTNTSEFGLLPTAEPLLFGPTRNPWDTERTSGGSSGGAAAAVAAGIVPMAHANDGGGSIRIPASCCGLFGLKPSRGRNSMAPFMIGSGVAVEHAVSRSVRDSAALLDATAGPAPGDPYWAPPPERPFIDEVGADPGKLRIAFSAKPINGVPVHADCLAALEDAAKQCEDLGHVVEEAHPDFHPNLGQKFSTVWMGMLGWTVADWTRVLGRAPEDDELEPWTWRGVKAASELSAADYLLAVQDTQSAGLDLALFLERYDLWLTPMLAAPPVPVGSFDYNEENMKRAHEAVFAFAAFAPICNITGNPAMSVPLFWNGEGLPIGVQFIAPVAEEALLFRLAAQLEQARPWADKRPPVSV